MVQSTDQTPSLGAKVEAEGVRFTVWAPATTGVELLLGGSDGEALPMAQQAGYHTAFVPGVEVGTHYRFRFGEEVFPDPASRYQPEGVHGASQVVDPELYSWRHPMPQPAPRSEVIYELHVGTFTPAGTFEGVCRRLPYLAELGVDTVEMMPVSDFPGRWNWGYDPAALFAPAHNYGPPDELRRLVDDAHGLGLRVLLDVVYNHFGPDGAYWPAIDPGTFTSRHRTAWGDSIDFDGPGSAAVRRFFIENALMWLTEYQFDGLRLDATFAIVDDSPCHLLTELAAEVASLPGPSRSLVAEDPRNSRNLVLPRRRGGSGLDAVWADDFHHQLRARLAGDNDGYFRDFGGSSREIAATLRENWFYRGHHSVHHGRPRGTQAADLPPQQFVFCIQNHDQVGNRADGVRLNHDVSLHEYRAATALLLFAPQTPLLFMGQEWAAATPFLFFTDHQGDLGKRVSEGRREEFADFAFDEEVPDPQDPESFQRSRLKWQELDVEPHASTLRFYRRLLELRRRLSGPIESIEVQPEGLALRRGKHLLLVAFEAGARFALPPGARTLLNSEDSDYAPDPLPPRIFGNKASGNQASDNEASGNEAYFPGSAALLLELGP